MAMSSERSSSMATVLLVVAVVASTWASGTQAVIDIENYCNDTVVITYSTNKTLTVTPQYDTPEGFFFAASPNSLFTPPLTFTIKNGKGLPPIEISRTVLEEWRQLGKKVKHIYISCDKNCIKLSLYGESKDSLIVLRQKRFCTDS